ncbi:putative CNNM, transmembrane domain-containing protein [Helianthus annuus]|nr:putative CNNM, transmembrane domain-containing protein [Helianthus annuus]
MAVEYRWGETEFFIHIGIVVLLVLFAGLMSGLTLGLMSLSLVDLEVLAKSGTPKDRKYAGNVFCLGLCLVMLSVDMVWDKMLGLLGIDC